MFLLWLRQLPRCGDRTLASVLPPTEGKASPPNTPISPPSSFVLPSFVWVSIFLSTGQVLLSALSWCSACTSGSEGAFLMHPWGEMYSTSTYCSAILFFSYVILFNSGGNGKILTGFLFGLIPFRKKEEQAHYYLFAIYKILFWE